MRILAALAAAKDKPFEVADPDRRRVARAQQGEAAAFEELIELHWPRVYRILARMLGDAADAAEAARETFLEAWQTLASLRSDTRFATWLYRIALSEVDRRLAGAAPRPGRPIDDLALEVPRLVTERRPRSEPAELRASLERFIAELPAGCRAAVVLHDVEGLTREEAAEALGLELATFRRLLHRGRMAIRLRLGELHRGNGPAPIPRLGVAAASGGSERR